MPTPLDLAIREHLTRYLAGTTTLDEFKDWLIGATWTVEETNDPATIDLTYEIKLLLAEQSSEDFSEANLREMLRPLVEDAAVPSR